MLELLHTLGASRIIVPEPVFDEVISGGYTDKAATSDFRCDMAREAAIASDSRIGRGVGDREGRSR